jgi:hypothetical protein
LFHFISVQFLSKTADSNSKCKVVSVLFNWAPCQEDVLGEWRYSSTHYFTSALDGGEWSLSRPGHFTPSERYLLDTRLGRPQSRSGRGGVEKNSQPLEGLEPPIIQPVAQSYTTELLLFIPCIVTPSTDFRKRTSASRISLLRSHIVHTSDPYECTGLATVLLFFISVSLRHSFFKILFYDSFVP